MERERLTVDNRDEAADDKTDIVATKYKQTNLHAQ